MLVECACMSNAEKSVGGFVGFFLSVFFSFQGRPGSFVVYQTQLSIELPARFSVSRSAQAICHLVRVAPWHLLALVSAR